MTCRAPKWSLRRASVTVISLTPTKVGRGAFFRFCRIRERCEGPGIGLGICRGKVKVTSQGRVPHGHPMFDVVYIAYS
jgi:hypothetical protein